MKAQRERIDELKRRLAGAETLAPDIETLRPAIVDAIREVRAALVGDAAARRDVLRALLGAERFRVYADTERGFRLEGALRVRLEPPARVEPGRGEGLVAGGGFEPPTSGL